MAFFGDTINKGATISECGKYRYSLWRIWAKSKPLLVWVMLNPSKANATEDDHTIKWCMRFAQQNGYGGIAVVNLFAYRATVPADMKEAADPIGPDNDEAIVHLICSAREGGGRVLVAWGTHGAFMERDRDAMRLIRKFIPQGPVCLGVTRGGFPKHPARLSPQLTLRQYEGRP